MAVCTYCDQEMNEQVACTMPTYSDFPDGLERDRIPYVVDPEYPPHCHDCWAPQGGLHHPGCCVERCPNPACIDMEGRRIQVIGCECADSEDDQ